MFVFCVFFLLRGFCILVVDGVRDEEMIGQSSWEMKAPLALLGVPCLWQLRVLI